MTRDEMVKEIKNRVERACDHIKDYQPYLTLGSAKLLLSECERLEAKVKQLEFLIKTQKDYAKLLVDEINEIVGLAVAHGWRSTRNEEGKRLRELIEKEGLRD